MGILFLAIACLAFALLPREAIGVGYGILAVASVSELFGSLLALAGWLLGASPFHQVGLVPAQPFKAFAAAAMLATGLATSVFRRRDLIGA
ncbi:MAG: hypothetical protein ACHQCF_01430 [Solirubrobacterales bacterium]